MAKDTEIEIVNVAWIKALLRCSTATVDRHIAAGNLPQPFKLGRDRLWVKSELIQHILKKAQVND